MRPSTDTGLQETGYSEHGAVAVKPRLRSHVWATENQARVQFWPVAGARASVGWPRSRGRGGAVEDERAFSDWLHLKLRGDRRLLCLWGLGVAGGNTLIQCMLQRDASLRLPDRSQVKKTSHLERYNPVNQLLNQLRLRIQLSSMWGFLQGLQVVGGDFEVHPVHSCGCRSGGIWR